MKSIGLGDTIEKITTATGLKTLSQIASRAIGAKDCGCNDRKQWLNNQFPYKKY